MLAGRPLAGCQRSSCVLQGIPFKRRAERVIPAVQETEQRNDGDDLENLVFGIKAAQLAEVVVRDGIRGLAGAP